MGEWITDAWTAVKRFFGKFWNSEGGTILKNALVQLTQAAGKHGLTLLLALAKAQVDKQEATGATGSVKREHAMNGLRADAIAVGITASTSLLAWAVETAVQALDQEK